MSRNHAIPAFPVQTGKGQPLSDVGEIKRDIEPLSGRAKKLGVWELTVCQFGHREPTLIVSLFLVIIMTALMLATGIWRKLFPWIG